MASCPKRQIRGLSPQNMQDLFKETSRTHKPPRDNIPKSTQNSVDRCQEAVKEASSEEVEQNIILEEPVTLGSWRGSVQVSRPKLTNLWLRPTSSYSFPKCELKKKKT